MKVILVALLASIGGVVNAAPSVNVTQFNRNTMGTRIDGKRVVIYFDYKIQWTNLQGDIKDAVDMGATVVVLGFWMTGKGGVDAAQTWAGLDSSVKEATLKYIHEKNAVLMVSAGVATEDMDSILKNGPSGTVYGSDVAHFAKENMLDGVDFDLELSPGNSAPFKDGSMTAWAVEATQAARKILGSTKLISHAPQGPYLSVAWAGEKGGYLDIFRQSKGDIDFMFIQYYNQGVGVYDTYEETFVKPGADWCAGSAVSQLIKGGIPSDALVVGKPVMPDNASNGQVPAATLKAWILDARGSLSFAGGVGGWMYATGSSDVCSWLHDMAATTGRPAPSKPC